MMISSSGNHMKNYLVFIALICFAGSAVAAKQTSPTTWDRSSAMAAARSVNTNIEVAEINNVSLLSDGKATVERLKQIEARTDWPIPAREAALYQFTRSLRDLPRAAVAEEVMVHLHQYQPQTLVPHEDHDNTLVPLFNIHGAAEGIENGWQRMESASGAVALLESNPDELVSEYVKTSNRNRRAGYLDSLGQADMADVEVVQATVLEKLDQAPELTPMLGVTTVRTLDMFAVQQLLIYGRGAGLSTTLKQLDQELHRSETAALLSFAIQQAPVQNASLAIAAWWPRLKHEAGIRDLLVEKLADPALGGAAALALAQSPDIQTIKILQDAADGESVGARRAQMALNINRSRLVGEVPQ
jgi:uncharacterized protein (DUF736 family)